MQNLLKKIVPLFLVSILFSSCSVIESIFKAGMGVGIFIIIAIVAVIIFIISRFSKKS